MNNYTRLNARIIVLSIFTISALSFGVNAQISEETVSSTTTTLVGGQNAVVTLGNSQYGVDYSLRNSSNVVVDGPLSGNNGSLDFNTGVVNATETFNVYAETTIHSGALEFDGTDDNVVIGDYYNSVLEVTFEAWVYWLDGTNDYHIIMAKEQVSAFAVSPNNKLHLNFGSGTAWAIGVNSVADMPVNQWVHVAGTRATNGDVKLYINGTLAGTGNVTAVGSNSLDHLIGAKILGNGLSQFFNGQIDEVRMWDHVRTQQEIQADMNSCLSGSENGLLSYYTFNQGAGDIVNDVVGDLDGTMTSMDASTDWITANTGVTCSTGTKVMAETVTITLNTAGINENELSNGIKIYPNPARNMLNIEAQSPIKEIKIFNLFGELIQTETTNSFSISGLASGVYFINILTQEGLEQLKFVKK